MLEGVLLWLGCLVCPHSRGDLAGSTVRDGKLLDPVDLGYRSPLLPPFSDVDCARDEVHRAAAALVLGVHRALTRPNSVLP